jgi:vancomycin resistance protein YoaR
MTTTTEELPPVEQESRRRSTALRFVAAFVVGAFVVGAAAAAGVYAFEQEFAGRILPGIRVGTTDVGGLTPSEAAAALDRSYASIGTGRIVVAGPDGEVGIPYADVSRRLDTDALVADALATGRAGTPPERVVAEIRTMLRGTTIAPRVVFDRAAVAARVTALAQSLDRTPVDATVARAGSAFRATSASDGRLVDGSAAVATLSGALANLDAPQELRVELATTVLEPTVDDADAGLAVAQAERIAQDLVLKTGKEEWSIPAATIRTWVGFSVAGDGRYAPTIDRKAALAAVTPLAKKIDRSPIDATFLIGKDDTIVGVKPGVNGRTLDAQATTDLVVAALAARVVPDSGTPSVEPALATTKPAVTTEQASQVAPAMVRVSSWTTWYPIYVNNGFGANIEIPTRAIDGTVVPAGGVFDFWKVVGPVSLAAGYRQGGAIIDGHTEPQGALAGGICSCSTTMFNAALRAGLEMGARLNHYYYIDRYPLGLDATVFISASGSVQTMSFTNDTPNPILVRGYVIHKGGRGYIRFEIWTVPTGRTVTFSTPIVKNVKPATTVTQQTSTLPAGQRKQIEYPVEGKDVWVTRTVRDASGKVIHEETYYSHYAMITGIILVGTGGTTTAPSPSPSPSPSPAVSPSPSPGP